MNDNDAKKDTCCTWVRRQDACVPCGNPATYVTPAGRGVCGVHARSYDTPKDKP